MGQPCITKAEMINAHKVLIQNPVDKQLFERPRRRWEDNRGHVHCHDFT
jgi:hypothetical protein